MERTGATGHGAARAIERMAQAGLNPRTVLDLAAQVAAHAATDTAALMVTLPTRAGDDRDDVLSRESNGNEVWSIIRDKRVVTLMLRRDDQPKTRTALRVERVIRLTYADGSVRAIDLK
jgi:hypothetical protein